MEPTLVVDFLDEIGKVFGDIVEGLATTGASDDDVVIPYTRRARPASVDVIFVDNFSPIGSTQALGNG